MNSLEFVIVQDMFLNEIARQCGSVFFPVASSFERDGTFMNSERRIQRVRKAIESPGQTKADWEIICELARAMGKGEFFTFNSPEEIWEEIRAGGKRVTAWLTHDWKRADCNGRARRKTIPAPPCCIRNPFRTGPARR